MPTGVYQRSPGIGQGLRQRAIRRREIQAEQAAEIERLTARLQQCKTALRRAGETMAEQRRLLNAIAKFRQVLLDFAEHDDWWESPKYDASAHVLLASLIVGADAGRIAIVTGLPRAVVVERELRLRQNGVWRGGALYMRWVDENEQHGSVAFALDVLVAEGEAYRAWDDCAYSIHPLPGPEITRPERARDGVLAPRDTRKHAIVPLSSVQPWVVGHFDSSTAATSFGLRPAF